VHSIYVFLQEWVIVLVLKKALAIAESEAREAQEKYASSSV
jgi:hypothetical protein